MMDLLFSVISFYGTSLHPRNSAQTGSIASHIVSQPHFHCMLCLQPQEGAFAPQAATMTGHICLDNKVVPQGNLFTR